MHCSGVVMSVMAPQLTGVSTVYSAVCSRSDQIKHQSSASLVFLRGIHRWPVNSPHKGPVTRKMFPFDDVIMAYKNDMLVTWIFSIRGLSHQHSLSGICARISNCIQSFSVGSYYSSVPSVHLSNSDKDKYLHIVVFSKCNYLSIP